MKNLKKLIPAICMLLVSATMLGTSTYAWFSMNRTVTATGMSVQATSTESLVISDKLPVGTKITVGFTSGTTTLYASTHSDTCHTKSGSEAYGTSDGKTTTNLAYVYNKGAVDTYTGEKAGSEELIMDNAVNPTSGTMYYVDYVVFLATSGKTALTNQTITVKFDDATVSELKKIAKERNTKNGIAIDFYIDAEKNNDTTNTPLDVNNFTGKTLWFSDETTELDIATGATIPLNTDSTCYRVVMRVYLDGAKKVEAETYELTSDTKAVNGVTYYTKSASVDEDGYYTYDTASVSIGDDVSAMYVKVATTNDYVYTDTVDVGDISFGVSFTASNGN